jgi:hypothetical protein
MNIHSGPTKLVLDEPLRFRRRARSNPCDFNEFLRALQSSQTIRRVECHSHQQLGITEDEWVVLAKTLGIIKGIQCLEFTCWQGSRDFYYFQAVADAVNNAHSLRKLELFIDCAIFPRYVSGLAALADALRQHPALEDFRWLDMCSPQEAQQDTFFLDPVLQALPDCPHLRHATIITECASADTLRNLLHSPMTTTFHLLLNTEQWLAVADEIRLGHCNLKNLTLDFPSCASSDEATTAVKAIANAIRQDENLESLELRMDHGVTDEAGVSLAAALTVNKTLHKIVLGLTFYDTNVVRATLGTQGYEAFSAMLRVNTSLTLELPPLDAAGGDQRVLKSHDQVRIEQRLNEVGRGELLSSNQTARAMWVDALHELNATNVDDTFAFQVSCLYSFLRLKPSAWML